ncbi:ExbD/TolR family protein [Zavarzinella formosa]|uniref:ExbD/TolR family protein n=1 Tax=Zavarzinella formosa TaxID=360055 RepID=UPI00031736E0|nr:biopolymer transporter ExbD [Zavarzinella formosa]
MASGPAIGGGGSGRKVTAAQSVGVLNLLTDMAFNLLIFFVVIASDAKDESGRPQQVPSASKDKTTEQKSQNVEVIIKRTEASVNGTALSDDNLLAKLKELLRDKNTPEERIVVVRSDKDTPYVQWIRITGLIEKARGIITLQLDEEKEEQVR